jgi:hypothetical protein
VSPDTHEIRTPNIRKIEVFILCFELDNTVGGFGAETFIPVDYTNPGHETVIALGHLPTGEKCLLQAHYQIVGSSDTSSDIFADFIIPAGNVCTDQPTINIGAPQSSCVPTGYTVTAIPTSGGANVTANAGPGGNTPPVVRLSLTPGASYSEVLVRVDCKDGQYVTSSYGPYTAQLPPAPTPSPVPFPSPVPAPPPIDLNQCPLAIEDPTARCKATWDSEGRKRDEHWYTMPTADARSVIRALSPSSRGVAQMSVMTHTDNLA